MLKHIIPLIPSHRLYTEAFCGGAAVLFAKSPVEAEIINDINMELTNFYWTAQVYYRDLKTEIDKTLHSRDLHAHAAHINAYPEFFSPDRPTCLGGLGVVQDVFCVNDGRLFRVRLRRWYAKESPERQGRIHRADMPAA